MGIRHLHFNALLMNNIDKLILVCLVVIDTQRNLFFIFYKTRGIKGFFFGMKLISLFTS